MKIQNVFERIEIKYLITRDQMAAVVHAMEGHMLLDHFGHTTIRNIYFDTDTYRIARQSIEKPDYKEKLRVRSYKLVSDDDQVFVELKKKYESVVYKRREAMPLSEAKQWLLEGVRENTSQITREISYFCSLYEGIKPKVYLSYERDAYYDPNDSTFRVTFDENIRARSDDLSLTSDVGGVLLLPEDMIVMEVKTAGGMPRWLLDALTKEAIYPGSFSKYGAYYINHIANKMRWLA